MPDADDGGDYVGVSELAGGAGGGTVVDDERITGRVKFRREWLDRHGLAAGDCRVKVLGESMEPTLVDGRSILVNQATRRRRAGRIFVVRTDDGLVVKRAGKDRAGAWQLVSDNPNKQTWPTVGWPADAPVIGEVKWAARTFRVRSDRMGSIVSEIDHAPGGRGCRPSRNHRRHYSQGAPEPASTRGWYSDPATNVEDPQPRHDGPGG